MSNPIELQYSPGKNVYVVIHNPDGRVWNFVDEAWQAYDSADWADLAVALTEQSGSGYYRAAYPIADVDVLTTEAAYQKMGSVPVLPSDPSNGDAPIGSAQTQGANVAAINTSVDSAVLLGTSAGSMEIGEVQTGTPLATGFITNLSGTLTNLYVGRVIIFTSGAAKYAARIITGYNGGTKAISFDALPVAPSVADAFIVV